LHRGCTGSSSSSYIRQLSCFMVLLPEEKRLWHGRSEGDKRAKSAEVAISMGLPKEQELFPIGQVGG